MSNEKKTVFHSIGPVVGLTASDCEARCKKFTPKAQAAIKEAAEKSPMPTAIVLKLFNAAAREQSALEAADKKASLGEHDDDETVEDIIVDSPIGKGKTK